MVLVLQPTTGPAHRVFSLTVHPVLKLAHLLLLQTSPVLLASGTRHLLRQSTMFPLRFTARLFVVALTSSSADLKLPTSLSLPLASVLALLLMMSPVLSVLSRLVHFPRSSTLSLIHTSCVTWSSSVVEVPVSLSLVTFTPHTFRSRQLQPSLDLKTSCLARGS